MIPFLDLKKINSTYKNKLHEALDSVIDNGWFILGEHTSNFESNFAKFCGSNYCIGVGNGLEALHLVLRAWNIGPGDEVIVPSNTYIATWLAVSYTGATLVPVEPELDSFNINPNAIKAAISPRTKAIIAVHLYGQAANMAEIMSIANKNGIKVLEDAAQAHGATFNSKRVGNLAHAAAFSFYPGKNLGALGDGGCITTNDQQLSEMLATLRNYGSRKKYHNEVIGYNSRLDELQSAFLNVKLPFLDEENARRQEIAAIYNQGLAGVNGIELPRVSTFANHVWHLYVIRHPERDWLQSQLATKQIATLIHYPIPPHLQPAYSGLGYRKGSFPISELLHEQVLSLPIGPTMSKTEAEFVVESIRSILS
jgi:dTDP-4-amino-4,6-dideoxygalactose transaminase